MNKTITTIALFFMLTTIGYSQIAKGTFRFGPSLDFSSSTEEISALDAEFKTSVLNLGISGAYYLIDNLEIGLGTSILKQKAELEDLSTTNSGFAIGPSVFYKVNAGENLYIPIGIGFTYSSRTTGDDVDEITLSGTGLDIGAGLEYLVNNRVGVILLLNYDFGSLSDNDSEDEVNIKSTNMSLGVNFYF